MVPRLLLYGVTSTTIAIVLIVNVLTVKPNFYAASVAVGRSSGALMVLANFLLFVTICVGIAVKSVFFGQLRAIEYEHLFERLWLFLTESLLALAIFRDDFSGPFVFMYGLLLFLKCFHWITADRVDYMDQVPPPGPPLLFHLRISSILSILTCIDLFLVVYSLETILTEGVSAMVLFVSEFMILLASINGTSARYVVGLIDLRRARGRADAPSWEEKSMYLFYVDLAVDFMKLLTYLSFFAVILFSYGIPLHILRDVYMTLRSFLSRCGDLIRYRRATRDMDALYPNASAEEMERLADKTCIICREEMVAQDGGASSGESQGPNETPKKLACGHVFHFHCLRSWLERQQSCPTCRRSVLRAPGNTGRGIAGNPPPPAPGAVPQLNQNVPINPIQQVYNEFFRPRDAAPPQMGQNAPTPPHPAPTAAPASGVTPTPTVDVPETAEQQMQRSIWGAPIVPGRFFPRPLGATGGYHSRTTPAGRIATSLPSMTAGPSRPTLTSTVSGPSNTTSVPPLSVPERTLASTADPSSHQDKNRTAVPTPTLASGSTTPFFSNPPQVFSSSWNADAASSDNESDARRLVAEAAMRRMGKRQSSIPLTTPELPEEADTPPVANGKGKGKEISPTVSSFDASPTHIPYLTSTSVLPHPHQHPAGAWTEEGTRLALDERLKMLRDVDEVVWGLVGELTRMRSAWEVEASVGEGGVKEATER